MIKYVGIMVGGIALGIVLDRIIIAIMENKKLKKEKKLYFILGYAWGRGGGGVQMPSEARRECWSSWMELQLEVENCLT